MAVKLGYKNTFDYPYNLQVWQQQGLPVESAPPVPIEEESTPRGPLSGWAMILTLLGIFAGGIALNLTPCVYPMIPITVSYFGGRAVKEEGEKGALLVHGLCYLVGISITYSLLGVVAALTGGLMGAMLQNPIVLFSVAIILLCFAASLFGLWELRLPAGITQAAAKSYAGYFGSLFMGLTLGVVAAPCLGPFVLGIFTWVASMGNPLTGFLIFFTLSLGMGLPLFVLALFSGQLKRLPRSGEWMLWMRSLMGWVLSIMAVYFVRYALPSPLGTILLALAFLGAGLHLGWIDSHRAGFRAFSWFKTVAGVAGLVAAAYILTSFAVKGPGLAWKSFSDDLLAEAAIQQKPVVIDFSAIWCAPCLELEETTFHDRGIVMMAEREYIFIKVDVSKAGDPLNERLIREYKVKGVPTVIFLNREGKEASGLRLTKYLPPDQFLVRLAEANRE